MENQFRIDNEGRTIFFPPGRIKKGYIISDEPEKQKIVNNLYRDYTIIYILWVLSMTISSYIILLAIACMGVHYIFSKRIVKGLPVSDLSLSSEEKKEKIIVELLHLISMSFSILLVGYLSVLGEKSCKSHAINTFLFITGILTLILFVFLFVARKTNKKK